PWRTAALSAVMLAVFAPVANPPLVLPPKILPVSKPLIHVMPGVLVRQNRDAVANVFDGAPADDWNTALADTASAAAMRTSAERPTVSLMSISAPLLPVRAGR